MLALRRISLVALLVLGTGCGGNIAPVSGRITLDGVSLAQASVILTPAQNPGPGSHATTDKEGRFILQLLNGTAKGAVIGKHKVSVTAYEGDADAVPSSAGGGPFRKALLPLIYNADTILTFVVPPGGSDKADFELSSKTKSK